jgi:hypothetical protein
MKVTQLALALTVVNLSILLSSQMAMHADAASRAAPVLRGSALELVDGEGRVRASITIHPAGPSVPVPDGRIYPETVVLRLIDPNGRPGVKIAASEKGSGLSFVGDTDRTQVVLKAEGADSSLKLASRSGSERIIKPE